jgi:nucleoside-diphosphate-sugar epimerase
MSDSSIKKVVVVGASGSVGRSTVKALLEEGFQVTGITRETSKATLPEGVTHVKSEYSEASLREAFRGQDAVISTIGSITPGEALALQKPLIDAAIAAGVKVFFPSEYGIDTSDPSAQEYIPFLADKIHTLNYLKAQQDKISWTAVVSGSMFDWGLDIPGFGGLNIPAGTATVFDGGDIFYEATNLSQVGKAIAKCLKKPNLTKNQYIYVNSFTVTQNRVLAAIEKASGKKFTVSESTVEELWADGAKKLKAGQPMGVLAMIAGAIYDKGGLAQFSATKGLWNEKLGLQQDNLDEVVKEYLARK